MIEALVLVLECCGEKGVVILVCLLISTCTVWCTVKCDQIARHERTERNKIYCCLVYCNIFIVSANLTKFTQKICHALPQENDTPRKD